MAQVRNAYMKMATARRVTTNAGYTFTFEPDVEKLIPGIAVQEVRKHGGIIVRHGDGSMVIPESENKMKVASLVTSSSSLVEEDDHSIPEEALEAVGSTTDEDADEAVVKAVKDMDSFNQKEARIKNAILALLSENDAENFVATTGMPKVSALSSKLGGEAVTAEVRDLVWRKMESAGIIEVDADESGDA